MSSFHEILLDLCNIYSAPVDNRLSIEVSEIVDSSEKVVIMLARCLPHIVPNVILSKRDVRLKYFIYPLWFGGCRYLSTKLECDPL